MELSNALLIIQMVSTVIFSLICWALKNVIASNMEPIKNDISGMRSDIHEIKGYWKEHRSDKHPHPTYEDYADDKFITKEQAEFMLENLKERLDWSRKNGN